MRYAAYGSNMNVKQMKQRCPGAKIVGKGTIPYRLTFHGLRRGVADIVPDKRCKTPVVIWEINDKHEKALDIYEGFPRLYVKETVPVETQGEIIEAMAYIMAPDYKVPSLPDKYYYEVIKKGYIDNGIDVNGLKKTWFRVHRTLRRKENVKAR